ncbi:helix-turn-helix domain-containing protein [Saccharopolyspora shandongensis]|uniref:helix-turn-helix domain-containing protein n=1 Tax=Saccharopolyspora shandongensis TaxID=418495 RepID=UPI0034086250
MATGAGRTPGPKVLRLQLGRELRRLREAAGIDSREAVATPLGWDVSKVSRVELGQSTVSADEIEQLLKLFGTAREDGERVRKLGEAARKRGTYGKVPDWAKGYIGMESDADALKIYYGELIPGPLQIDSYARAILSTSVTVAAADIDRLVQSRARRREILVRDDSPTVEVVLGEAVLRRHVGGPAVLRDQLKHLREMAELPHVTLQVLQFSSGEHAALETPFTLLYLREVGATYVYLEDLTSADFWDRAPHVPVYEMVFDRLQIAALGKRETLATLDRAIADLA